MADLPVSARQDAIAGEAERIRERMTDSIGSGERLLKVEALDRGLDVLAWEVAELKVDEKIDRDAGDGFELEVETVPWMLVGFGIVSLIGIICGIVTAALGSRAMGFAFVGGVLLGWVLCILAGFLFKGWRSPEEWKIARGEMWSGKIVGTGPPAAAVFNDDETADKLMLAFCDPGAVTSRLDRDTSEPEPLHAWQRRAVKLTIENIWEGE